MLILQINSKRYPVADMAAAATRYRQYVGNKGASRCVDGLLFDQDGTQIGRVGYNGKVWTPEPWTAGAIPLYAPGDFYGDIQELPRVQGVPQYPAPVTREQHIDALHERLREDRLSKYDAEQLLWLEQRAERPCPDVTAYLYSVIAAKRAA